MGRVTPEHLVDQAGQRGGRQAEEPGHDLGVEHSAGTAPQAAMQHVEVLPAAWATAMPGPVEHLGQRGGVDGERVDQRHLVGPGDLDEGQLG